MPFWKRTSILALALGLGWAVRGHFGHEWGASWAGAIAGFAAIAVSGRADWHRRIPVLAALSAVGWAVGGMMSYGILVGMGRAGDFVNTAYGLAMLAVVGGLYGFVGGGFLGLGLETTESHRPDWARLLAEMVAGGWIVWGFLIYQLEWLMTPPRSELWAACLGASIALGWYLLRSDFKRAFRVAGYAALGAGLGFASGNFIQTLGHLSGVAYNWWNVMEFTLGALGGIGLAYGTFTTAWPESVAPSRTANRFAILFLLIGIPGTNIFSRFGPDRFLDLAEQTGWVPPELLGQVTTGIAWIVVFIMLTAGLWIWSRRQDRFAAWMLGAICTFGFILLSHLQKGLITGVRVLGLEQWNYWVLVALIVLLARNTGDAIEWDKGLRVRREGIMHWISLIFILILIVLTLAAVSSALHDGIPGMQKRF